MKAMLKNDAASQQLLRRVRSEYLECPGLNLTAPQLRRFLDVDEATCRDLIDTLLASHFLERDNYGQLVVSHPLP